MVLFSLSLNISCYLHCQLPQKLVTSVKVNKIKEMSTSFIIMISFTITRNWTETGIVVEVKNIVRSIHPS